MIEQFDANRDGRVQRKELAAFLAGDDAGVGPFAVQSVNDFRGDAANVSPLFVVLDEDQDGRLSTAEISTAIERLRSRDADDDDVVTVADFRRPVDGEAAMRRGGHFGLELARRESGLHLLRTVRAV